CIQIGGRLSRHFYNAEAETFEVEAGKWVPQLSRIAMLHGYTGAEHICGIPGTAGGLVCMNGGSQRKGISSSVVSVQSVTETGEVKLRTRAECRFGYRDSIFQSANEIILSVKLK